MGNLLQRLLAKFSLSGRERDELDRLRVQLAGCTAAALGWGMDDKQRAPKYSFGWSPAYGDVYNLRRRYDYLIDRLEERAKVRSCDCLTPQVCPHREARQHLAVMAEMCVNEELR